MRTTNGTEQLLIGKSIARTATVNVLDSANASYLADGEIVVLDENDTPLVAGTTFPTSRFIKIVQRSGSVAADAQLVQSARIDGSNVISFRGLSYAAPQEQILHVGYNGTSGAIDATGTEDFVLRITMTHDKDMWSQRSNSRIYRFTPVVTSIDVDVVNFFAQSMAHDAFLSTEVSTERLSSAANVADAATWTFTKGSPTATVSVAPTAVVGDFIRNGNAVTSAVYKIIAISGLNVTLDVPYQTTSLAPVAPGYITAAIAALAATTWGLKVTGKVQTFQVMKFPYLKVKFNLTIKGFGSTTVVRTQESLVGSGVGAQISQIEQVDIGFEGAVDRFGPYAPTGRSDASLAANYDLIVLEYFNSYDTLAISGAKPARSVLNLAIVDAALQTTNILAQLNPWMASVPQAFSNVAV